MSRTTLGGRLVVAVDGPSGTGKSTAARRLARGLGAAYLDTGAMYRAAALNVLRARVDPSDVAAVATLTSALELSIGTDPATERVQLGGVDVGGEIRGPDVTSVVSAVSAVGEVRRVLVDRQRALVEEQERIVVEGRDIGTVVLPDADLKIYLTASATERARRRAGQDARADYAAVLAEVQRRDDLDSTRVESPLRPAEEAVSLDTSSLDLDEVVARMHGLVDELGVCR